MNNYAIITPTFTPHFKYIKEYLKSYNRYVKDKKQIKLVFIISASEEQKFSEIISPYKEACVIDVLLFEDLLKQACINLTPSELLTKYGKFSFQTIKKFLALLFVKERYSLVLDSESMWVKDVEMGKVFEDYFRSPFVVFSDTSQLSLVGPVKAAVMRNNKILFPSIKNEWFLETFAWFYDKNILEKMFATTSVFDHIDKVYRQAPKEDKEWGCFEIEMYCSYLYLNRDALKYRFVDAVSILKNILDEDFNSYMNLYNYVFHGESGCLEQVSVLQNKKPIQLGETLKTIGVSAVRCSFSTLVNINYQKEFFDSLSPAILAASQDHCFGINNEFKKKIFYLLLKNNDTARAGYYALREVIFPFYKIFHWGKSIVKLPLLSLSLLVQFVKNLKVFK